jgi:hypothetical protein
MRQDGFLDFRPFPSMDDGKVDEDIALGNFFHVWLHSPFIGRKRAKK